MLANDPFAGDAYSAHPAFAAPELVSENGQVAPPPAPVATQTVYSPGANFGGYNSAAQNEAAQVSHAGLRDNTGAVQQYLHNARVSYARQQLAKYRRAAPSIQGFSSQLKNYDGADPIAAYKALSAAMAAMAQQHGYADPRVFLHNALNGGTF